MASRIEDYALIGDCETAALVGATARSTGLFSTIRLGRLLRRATRNAGSRSLADRARRPRPTNRTRVSAGTLVLETDCDTATGAVTAHRLHASAHTYA